MDCGEVIRAERPTCPRIRTRTCEWSSALTSLYQVEFFWYTIKKFWYDPISQSDCTRMGFANGIVPGSTSWKGFKLGRIKSVPMKHSRFHKVSDLAGRVNAGILSFWRLVHCSVVRFWFQVRAEGAQSTKPPASETRQPPHIWVLHTFLFISLNALYGRSDHQGSVHHTFISAVSVTDTKTSNLSALWSALVWPTPFTR